MALEQDPRVNQGPTFFQSLYAWMKRVAAEVNAKASTAWATAGLSMSIGPVGYIKLPDWMGGLVVQYGSSVVTTDASGNAPISFPLAFPASVRTVVVSNGDSASGNLLMASYTTGWPTLAGHAINVKTANTGANLASASVRCNWVAFGN